MKNGWKVKKINGFDNLHLLRGSGLNKSAVNENGKFECILYGELYTKYTNPVIKKVFSKTNFNGNIKSEIGDVLVPGTTTADAYGIAIARALNKKGVVLGGDINILRTKNKEILSDYLSYYLNGSGKDELASYATGTNIMHLSNRRIQEMEIPYPSLSEQKRIVSILDKAFADISKAKENSEKNLKNAKDIYESYLRLVFDKKGDDWEEKILDEVCEFRNGAAHERHIDEDGEYILVNSKFISTGGEKIKRTNSALAPLYVNDIAFVMSDVPKGKALAKCFLVDKDDTYTLNQRIGAIKSKVFIPEFLVYQFNRSKYLLSFDNGENQTNLRKGDILKCPLFIPSKKKQQSIIHQLNYLKNEIRKLEVVYKKKSADIDELKKSILQKAFNGDL